MTGTLATCEVRTATRSSPPDGISQACSEAHVATTSAPDVRIVVVVVIRVVRVVPRHSPRTHARLGLLARRRCSILVEIGDELVDVDALPFISYMSDAHIQYEAIVKKGNAITMYSTPLKSAVSKWFGAS